MPDLNDFAIEVDKSYDEIYRRILEDCELPKNMTTAFKQQFSRYGSGHNLKKYNCQETANGLLVEKPILYRNSFALQMNLEFAVRENITVITCRFRVHILVKLFMCLFAVPLLLVTVFAAVLMLIEVINGTKTAGDSLVLGALPLFGAFIAALYFGARKISEPNAVELKNWLLELFPYRMVKLEK